ncbi:MAG: serine/threonine kinase family protein [Myxococcales bacterium]|nr:serine/threonine kinase family protein [Myxococcales bacterium]
MVVGGPDKTDVEEPTEATKREGQGSHRKPSDDKELARLERGTLVGRYVVLSVVGEGGMGVVYAAYDPELDRKVAVKLLQAKPSGGSGGDQAWLLREAQAMARLSHPNVIAVHDVGTLPGDRVFVAMELVEGVTLRAWLKATPRPWREVLQVMVAAGAGLAAAHAVDLVHRDFKPDNVLVGRDGRVRVMDFGLARLRSDDEASSSAIADHRIEAKSPLSTSLTILGTLVGTPAYIAPELYEGNLADGRSDQFSFGVALYEALFHIRPFPKDAPRQKPAPPDVGIPARLQKVVLRSISLDPGERFGSMQALLSELEVVAAPRRKILIASAVLAVAIIAVAGGLALSSSRGKLCRGADRRLVGTWDPAVKQTIRHAFEATKLPFEATAFAGLERALDGYTGEWTSTVVESCEATRVRGEQTEEVLTLRQACLDQRLDELRALTQLLATADGDLVEKGDKIASGLEPLKRCSNITALRAPGMPPTEPKAKVDEMYAQLAEAKAQLLGGRYFPSIVAAKKASKLAEEIQFEPARSESLLVAGAALVGAGNFEDSETTFTEAVWAGLRSGRDDVLAQAALSAAVVAAQSRVGEAKIWLGLARTAESRVGHDPGLELRQLQVEGLVAASTGDLNSAIDAQQKALAASERVNGRDSPAMWTDEEVIGATLAKAGAYEKATPHFERAIALHERSVGPDHPDIALILTTLGACYAHAGDPRARKTYERAIEIREKIEGPQSPMLISTLNNMADGMIKSGDTAGALVYLDRAKQLAKTRLGEANPLYHAVATTHAEALAAAGHLTEARAELDEIVSLEVKASSALLGETLTSRGTIEIGAKQWTSAQGFDQRAIATFEATNGKDSPELRLPLIGLAQAAIGLGKPAEARPLLVRAIQIGEKSQLGASDLAPTRALLAGLKP